MDNRNVFLVIMMMVLGQYRAVLFDTWWYWVSKRRYWLVLGGNGSALGSTDCYLVVLGHQRVLLVDTL